MNTREQLLKKLYANYQYWQKKADSFQISEDMDMDKFRFYSMQESRYEKKFESLLFDKCH